MFKSTQGLVVSCLAVIGAVLLGGCSSVPLSPAALAKEVSDTYGNIQSADFEFRSEERLIGGTDEELIAANRQTIVAPVLMTIDQLGFAAYKNGQRTPFRMVHRSEDVVSEYYRGRSTQYELNAPTGIREPKFLAGDDCLLAPCFVFEFGRSELRDIESISDGTRDFAEENRLFLCEGKDFYVVRREREFEGENPPFDNWKRIDVTYIDRQSKLIAFSISTQLDVDGTGMQRERHFTFAHVSKEVPASFSRRLAEFKSSIEASTIVYVDPDTLDAEKAEYFAKMQQEYELAMEANQKEGEKRTEVQPAKEADDAVPEPVQQGG